MAIPLFVRSTVLAILAVATSGENPVGKVITLLEDLKKEVLEDGKSEATSYGEFACFCKDNTETKSTSIKDTEDKIQTLSGDIAKDTAEKNEKETEVKERKAKHKLIGEELTTEHSRCSAAQADFEYAQADITKALDSLDRAIKAMEAKKAEIGLSAKKAKVTAKSFLELDQDVKRALALAGIDPSDPAYKYHSKEINEILAKLKKDFDDEKTEGQEKWETEKQACQEKKDGLDKQMKDNLEAISKAEEKIEELAKKIADDRESLVEAQKELEQDELYLKDLTSQCEAKAHVWDQRSAMRNSEVEAIEEALKILSNDAKENAEVLSAKEPLGLAQNKVKLALAKPVSFLQTAPAKAVTNFLAKQGVSDAEQARQDKVVNLLRAAGTRLGSTDLYLLAMRVNVDHYKEVKALIQKLIERLLDEEKAEASKKGFCDTEIGKAKNDRDNTQARADSMSADLKEFEATKEELEAEIKQLGEDIEKAQEALDEATKLRKEEKEQNMETLKKAQEGRDAVADAIKILEVFYQKAWRAKVLLQKGPVEAPDAGFEGAYKGDQKGSRAVFALLETIHSDFERTIKETEQAEESAERDYVELSQTSKADIGSKEEKTKLDEADLEVTENSIKNTLDDLETTMNLQADALKMLDSLKPACLDAGGLNYKARSDQRQEEIAALQEALKALSE